MNFFYYLLIFFVLIIFILLYNNINNNLKKINSTLNDIKNKNFNQRIRLQTCNKNLKLISNNINNILDTFQNIQNTNVHLELSRKQLISNISHDLRTPLTSILGYTEMLETNKNLNEEEKQKYIHIISSKSNYLYSLLEDFFKLSKLDSNDVPLKIEKIDLNEKVKECIAIYYNDFTTKNITPEIKLSNFPLFIAGDTKSIDRILNNLFSNSLRYAKNYISIETKIRNSKIWVSIKNNGKGIPSCDLPYIFDRLYTPEPSRNLKYQGSGLGLCIAKTLIEKHNGQIYVESYPNSFTSFSFYIPLYI